MPRMMMPQQMQDIGTPHDHDVLSGRGNFVNYHAGNEHFRALVRKHKVAYVACPKQQKGKFSRLIVEEIRARNPPGRFLKQDPVTKLWHDIGEKKALDKTRQALREGAPEIMKEISGDEEAPPDSENNSENGLEAPPSTSEALLEKKRSSPTLSASSNHGKSVGQQKERALTGSPGARQQFGGPTAGNGEPDALAAEDVASPGLVASAPFAQPAQVNSNDSLLGPQSHHGGLSQHSQHGGGLNQSQHNNNTNTIGGGGALNLSQHNNNNRGGALNLSQHSNLAQQQLNQSQHSNAGLNLSQHNQLGQSQHSQQGNPGFMQTNNNGNMNSLDALRQMQQQQQQQQQQSFTQPNNGSFLGTNSNQGGVGMMASSLDMTLQNKIASLTQMQQAIFTQQAQAQAQQQQMANMQARAQGNNGEFEFEPRPIAPGINEMQQMQQFPGVMQPQQTNESVGSLPQPVKASARIPRVEREGSDRSLKMDNVFAKEIHGSGVVPGETKSSSGQSSNLNGSTGSVMSISIGELGHDVDSKDDEVDAMPPPKTLTTQQLMQGEENQDELAALFDNSMKIKQNYRPQKTISGDNSDTRVMEMSVATLGDSGVLYAGDASMGMNLAESFSNVFDDVEYVGSG